MKKRWSPLMTGGDRALLFPWIFPRDLKNLTVWISLAPSGVGTKIHLPKASRKFQHTGHLSHNIRESWPLSSARRIPVIWRPHSRAMGHLSPHDAIGIEDLIRWLEILFHKQDHVVCCFRISALMHWFTYLSIAPFFPTGFPERLP